MDLKNLFPSKSDFNDKLVLTAITQLSTSTQHKQPRMDQIKKYVDLYNGKVEKKLKQQFNVPLPILSGMVDTLAAALNDPVRLNFIEQEPADYLAAKKVQACWNTERSSQRASVKWDQKDRWAKKLAIFSGRGILEFHSESEPYRSMLEVVDYSDFHCEPNGGGHLENHLFVGQEGIFMTREDLIKGVENRFYDKEQVDQLIRSSKAEDWKTQMSFDLQSKFERFRALGLNAESNNYVGQEVYPLCKWIITMGGQRYYMVYDPWTTIWLRVEKLSDVYGSDYFPFVSYATHEDPKVFWSKSFCDDFYPVADSTTVLFNQELTNRQKKNFQPRAYDQEMFPDVAKLDESSHRPDALVPVDTKGGLRQIGAGIYEFKTPELQGTINLIEFMEGFWGKETGVTEVLQGGGAPASKRVNVHFAELQSAAKRLDYRAASYQEAWVEIGNRYLIGLKENIGSGFAVRMLGEDGFNWELVGKADITTKKELDIKVLSESQILSDNQLNLDKKKEAITMLAQSGNVNSKWRDEQIMRFGGWSDDEIAIAMDTQNYGNKELLAKASAAIQVLLSGKMPDLEYGADTAYLKKIYSFAVRNRVKLGAKFILFTDYIEKNAQLATENMIDKAKKIRMEQGMGVSATEEETPRSEGGMPLKTIPQVGVKPTSEAYGITR